MHYVHKKARCGPELATFRTKTLHFLWVIRLNWLAKIELKGTRRPWSSILLTRYLLWAKNAKKILKKQLALLSHFCHWWNLNWRGPLPPLPLPTPMLQVRKTKRCSQIFREVSGVFQRNFNCSKNSAALEPRTGQFSRTWGFEAKDFKMCPRGRPRGQERFRGLHLC